MKAEMAIMMCDADEVYGCDEWAVDYEAQGVMNWRELLAGWTFDPATGYALCPKHPRRVSADA